MTDRIRDPIPLSRHKFRRCARGGNQCQRLVAAGNAGRGCRSDPGRDWATGGVELSRLEPLPQGAKAFMQQGKRPHQVGPFVVEAPRLATRRAMHMHERQQ